MNAARQILRCLVFAAAILTFAACHPVTIDDKLDARDDASFDQWIAKRTSQLTPGEIRELNDARQTFRFKISQAHLGAPREELSQALYAEIGGWTRRELLIAACELQIERVNVALANYAPMVAKMKNYEGGAGLSEDEKHSTEVALEQLNRHVREHQEQLAEYTKRLAELRSAGTSHAP